MSVHLSGVLSRGGAAQVAVAAALLLALTLAVVFMPWLQAVAVVLGVATAALLVVRPYAAVLAFLSLRTVLDMLWWTDIKIVGMNLLQLGSGAMIAMALVLVLLRASQIKHHPLLPLIVVFFAFIGLAAVRATSLGDAAKLVAELTSPMILLLLVSTLANTPARRRGVLVCIAVASLLPIGIGLYHLVAGTAQYDLHGYRRLLGGYSNLHNHAIIMGAMVPMGVALFVTARRPSAKVMTALYLLGAGTCLYFTYVRTALLSLAVFGVVFLIAERRWRTLLWLAPAGLLFLLFSTTMQDRFSDLWDVFSVGEAEVNQDRLGSGRWRLWREGISFYMRSGPAQWVIGSGLGSHWQSTFRGIDPHSDLLSVLIQTGPVGVLMYLGLMARTAARGWKLRLTAELAQDRTFASFVACLMAVVLISICISNAHITRPSAGWYVWALVGVLFATPPRAGVKLLYQRDDSST